MATYERRVKEALEAQKKSQRWLAQEINVTPQHMGDMLKGNRSIEKHKQKINECLKIK